MSALRCGPLRLRAQPGQPGERAGVSELGPTLAAGSSDPTAEDLHAATRGQGSSRRYTMDYVHPDLGGRRATWMIRAFRYRTGRRHPARHLHSRAGGDRRSDSQASGSALGCRVGGGVGPSLCRRGVWIRRTRSGRTLDRHDATCTGGRHVPAVASATTTRRRPDHLEGLVFIT